jgi:DNA repair exonuclease SbcCD ATPase subunit
MLEQSLSAVQQQYEDAKPRLEDAQRKRTQILRKIELCRISLKDDVRRLASIHNREICGELPKLAGSYQPKNAISLYKKTEDSLLPIGFKKQAETLTKEVTTWLLSRIEVLNNEWRKREFEPLIKQKIEEMSSEVSHSMQEFLALVDEIKTDLSGFQTSDVGFKEPEPWERILAAVGGFYGGGMGSALVGGTLGIKQMAINVALNLSVVVVTAFFVGLNLRRTPETVPGDKL